VHMLPAAVRARECAPASRPWARRSAPRLPHRRRRRETPRRASLDCRQVREVDAGGGLRTVPAGRPVKTSGPGPAGRAAHACMPVGRNKRLACMSAGHDGDESMAWHVLCIRCRIDDDDAWRSSDQSASLALMCVQCAYAQKLNMDETHNDKLHGRRKRKAQRWPSQRGGRHRRAEAGKALFTDLHDARTYNADPWSDRSKKARPADAPVRQLPLAHSAPRAS
jgi:hypothetical protein